MARVTLCDLKESPGVEQVLVGDLHQEAADRAAQAQGDGRFKGQAMDVRNVEATANAIRGYDVVINSTQYYFNLEVMRACLSAGVHYLDLGGLFHMTRKQMPLHDEFVKANLLAILGVGSTPGMTNVMARYACDQLTRVEACDVKIGAVDLAQTDSGFVSPYSIATIVDECVIPPYVFDKGEWAELPPFSGEEHVTFPHPIGTAVAHYTIHSEVATFPLSFKDKGIQRATFRIAFPASFIHTLKLLTELGLLDSKAVRVGSSDVSPRDLVVRVLGSKVAPPDEVPDDCDCIRVDVLGTRNGHDELHIVESLVRPHPRWKSSAGALDTGVPPSIVAQMMAKNEITARGVLNPEQCIDPRPFFEALAKRGIHVQSTVKAAVT
jgi:saccharopine dehydrogenase-like NADP-dependent oxidoreductase